MNKTSLVLFGICSCLVSGCLGLQIGGTTNVPAPAAVAPEKATPTAKDYGLSDEATAAFLNDKDVISAYQQIDMQHSDQSSFLFKEAIRTLDRKAAIYKAKYPVPTCAPAVTKVAQ